MLLGGSADYYCCLVLLSTSVKVALSNMPERLSQILSKKQTNKNQTETNPTIKFYLLDIRIGESVVLVRKCKIQLH